MGKRALHGQEQPARSAVCSAQRPRRVLPRLPCGAWVRAHSVLPRLMMKPYGDGFLLRSRLNTSDGDCGHGSVKVCEGERRTGQR
eukprot:6184964-Pleurochrysis_carterae.AAC.5